MIHTPSPNPIRVLGSMVAAALLLISACSNDSTGLGMNGKVGSSGAAGSTSAGAAGSTGGQTTGAAGSNMTGSNPGTAGQSSTPGTAGSTPGTAGNTSQGVAGAAAGVADAEHGVQDSHLIPFITGSEAPASSSASRAARQSG